MTRPKRVSGMLGLAWTLAALGTAPAQAQTATETVLHSFSAPTGKNPHAGVIRDPAGGFYGTALTGGTTRHSVVYKLDAADIIRWCTTSPAEPMGRTPSLA